MSKGSILLENELKSLVHNALIIVASKNCVCLIMGNHRIVIIIMDGSRKYIHNLAHCQVIAGQDITFERT